jgi:hypothetical protein
MIPGRPTSGLRELADPGDRGQEGLAVLGLQASLR